MALRRCFFVALCQATQKQYPRKRQNLPLWERLARIVSFGNTKPLPLTARAFCACGLARTQPASDRLSPMLATSHTAPDLRQVGRLCGCLLLLVAGGKTVSRPDAKPRCGKPAAGKPAAGKPPCGVAVHPPFARTVATARRPKGWSFPLRRFMRALARGFPAKQYVWKRQNLPLPEGSAE